MRIITCDDEEKVLAQLGEWSSDYFSIRKMEVSFEKYSTEKEFQKKINEYDGSEPIIIFLDMKQKWEQVLTQIRGMRHYINMEHIVVVLIFGNEYGEYIQKIFGVNPSYILVKPLSRKKFDEAMDFVLEKTEDIFARTKNVENNEKNESNEIGGEKEEAESYLVISRRGEKKKIDCQDIYYIERNLRKTEIHCIQEKYECYEKLSSLKERLGKNFVRCHNSFIVNLDYVKSVKRTELTLKDGRRISVSNSKSKETRELAAQYLKKRRILDFKNSKKKEEE